MFGGRENCKAQIVKTTFVTILFIIINKIVLFSFCGSGEKIVITSDAVYTSYIINYNSARVHF